MKKNNMPVRLLCLCAALMVGNAHAALITTAEEGSVNAGGPIKLKDPSLAGLWRRAAAADGRPASDYDDNYANDIGDAVFFAPGVWSNALDINEPRLSLRGFAVGNRQERSTVSVYRDGAPLTDVHGATNAHEIDLLSVSRVEVLRGGGDFRRAGGNLGGAVDFISPSGMQAERLTARIDAGASIENTPGGRVHVSAASQAGDFDFYAGVTGLYEEGFRDNNRRDSVIFNGNLGYRFSNNFKTRFFVEAIRSQAELAGGLTPADAAADPNEPQPPITLGPLFPGGPIIQLTDGARTDDFARDILVGRIANQTEFRFLGHDFEAGGHFARRDVESPQIDFIGVIDEEGQEWGVRLAASRSLQLFGVDTRYRLGGDYSKGSQSSDRFENLNGLKGDQFVDTEQKSTNLNAFLEAVFNPLKRLAVDIGGKFTMVDRELTDLENDNFQEVRFIGVSARGAAAYNVSDDIQIFAGATRLYEPPSFSELISDNPENFNGLDEQDSFTYEAGFRGAHRDWVRWEIVYFNTDVENEIVNVADPDTTGLGALVNVESSTHKGFEAGLDINLIPALTARSGQALTWRSAYSYNDFRFNIADPLDVDGNRLAGVPEHVYRGELRYDADGRWYVGANVQIAAGEFYADHENLVSVPTYTLVGFSAGLKLNDRMEVFASGENITDINYAAGVTPVLSQTADNARIITPGNRATFYGGLKVRF